MREVLRTSLTSDIFLIVVPVAAAALTIATFVPAPPVSVALIVMLIFTIVALRFSAWILYRTRTYAFNEHDFSSSNLIIGATSSDDQDTKKEEPEGGNDEDENDDPEDRHHSTRSSLYSHYSSRSHRSARIISSIKYFNRIQPLMRPSRPIIILFYSSITTLVLTLMIRLFAVNKFGGKASLLDYGTKVSKDGEMSATNIALEEFDKDTFAHVIQGVLAAFLSYPAVAGLLSKLATRVRHAITKPKYFMGEKRILLLKPCFFTLNFIKLLQSSLTYYPFYSMIKRLRYTTFSQTSHLNNTTEWLFGCIFGLSFGCVVSSLLQRQLLFMTACQDDRKEVLSALSVYIEVDVEDNNKSDAGEGGSREHGKRKMKRYMFGKASEYEGITKHPYILKVVEILSLLNLTVFAVTTMLTGLFIGLSWNHEDDYKVSVGMTILFLLIFIFNFSIFVYLSFLR